MKKFETFKPLMLLMLSLLSPWVLAHPGHGGDAGPVHDMEHTLWMLFAIAVIVTAVLAIVSKKWNLWK